MINALRLSALLVAAILPSFLKIFVYRYLFNARIGRKVSLGFGSVLLFQSMELGDEVKINALCLVRAKGIKIGPRSRIGILTRITVHTLDLGPSVTIGPQVSILASVSDDRCIFRAGAESWIFEYCYINPARPISLGRNVGVGGGSYIFAHGLWLSRLKGYPVSFGGVSIGDDVWLPWGCFIMPGVEIGSGAVVGARSVVTKDVPPKALVAGSPAKIIRETAANEPLPTEKVDILLEATFEFCQLSRLALKVEKGSDWIVLCIDERVEIKIALDYTSKINSNELSTALHVIHGEFTKSCIETSVPIYSLASFQCSPRKVLSRIQRDWLHHLRQIGTRHYPIDEVVVECSESSSHDK